MLRPISLLSDEQGAGTKTTADLGLFGSLVVGLLPPELEPQDARFVRIEVLPGQARDIRIGGARIAGEGGACGSPDCFGTGI